MRWRPAMPCDAEKLMARPMCWYNGDLPGEKGRQMKKIAVLVLVALLALLAAWQWMQTEPAKPAEPATAAQTEAPQSAPSLAPASNPPPTEPAIAHPVPPSPTGAPSLPALQSSDATVLRLLTDLLGAKAVQDFLQQGDFIRHFVATVDNLGRDHASSMIWPMNPTPGHFTELVLEKSGDKVEAIETISPQNALRYRPFVQFVSAMDATKAARLYFSVYPLFQQAYEELGFPKKYFNDRLVQVLDLLIATPEPTSALELHQIAVPGMATSTRPLFEFADPALEHLSAGQKILLRVGADNAQQLRRKLTEFRAAVSVPRTAQDLAPQQP